MLNNVSVGFKKNIGATFLQFSKKVRDIFEFVIKMSSKNLIWFCSKNPTENRHQKKLKSKKMFF